MALTEEQIKIVHIQREAARTFIRAHLGRSPEAVDERLLKKIFPITKEVPRIVKCAEFEYRLMNNKVEFRSDRSPTWKVLYDSFHNDLIIDLLRNPVEVIEE